MVFRLVVMAANFLLLAALVFINTLPVLLFKEPPHTSHSDNQSSQPNLLIKLSLI